MLAQLSPDYIRTRPAKALTRIVSYALFEGRPLTTRGQWFNPIVFGVQHLALKLPHVRAVQRPVFIIGTGRSGTTILGVILSMHRDVAFLNEPKALWHRIHPEEDVIGSYAEVPGRFHLGAAEATPECKRVAHQLFGAYLSAVRGRRLVDKYPELVYRVAFVRALFPDARFLFLVRNGWDTCQSIDQWSQREGVEEEGGRHDWWGRNDLKWRLMADYALERMPALKQQAHLLRALTDHRQRAAVEWVLAMRAGLDAEQRYPDAVRRVAYEDLTADPSHTLGAVADFCGLVHDEIFLAFGQRELTPVPPRPPFDLPDWIGDSFESTMVHLGY